MMFSRYCWSPNEMNMFQEERHGLEVLGTCIHPYTGKPKCNPHVIETKRCFSKDVLLKRFSRNETLQPTTIWSRELLTWKQISLHQSEWLDTGEHGFRNKKKWLFAWIILNLLWQQNMIWFNLWCNALINRVWCCWYPSGKCSFDIFFLFGNIKGQNTHITRFCWKSSSI